MEKLKELNEVKHTLLDAVKMQVSGGLESVNTEELGEVVDMIKDLASAEKDCMEAAYYELVCEAMSGEENGRMGYDRWRYASGRFAPKGRGTYGYLPSPNGTMMMDDTMGYVRDDRNGAANRGTMRSTERTANRMGYHDKAMDGMEPKERLDVTIDTMGDIWAEADHDLKGKMKTVVKDLLYQMEHGE